jgi:hypothetical protein
MPSFGKPVTTKGNFMYKVEDFNEHNYPTNEEIDKNLKILCDRINALCEAFGKYPFVTSGLRSEAQQNGLIADGKSNSKKSKHLMGAAADLFDPDGKFKQWVSEHLDIAEQIGLWFEQFDKCPNWIHCQILPPNSGNRVYKI